MFNSNSSQPDKNADRDERLEAVVADYIRACETGTAPNRDEILSRHSELADELRQFFGQRDRMDQIAAPIRGFGDSLAQTVGPGQRISYVGNYELLEKIARGGMGVVYKARQTTLGRIVAVKMIVAGPLASEQDVQRFQVEAQAAAGLQHPNIVSIHEVGQHEGWHYFSMDYVEGRDLSQILRENLLSPRQAATYVRQMAEAIHYSHRQGILHRDLKPSNIMIDSHDQVRITDFGLAVRVEGGSELTHTGQILGTPSYMPPEQAQGKRSLIGPGSDVYSLGAVLYECLTGRAPFRAESVLKTIEQVINAEAASPRTLNASIPKDLETICLKCLEKEPYRRYSTAQHLADDLQRYLDGHPILARPASVMERTLRLCSRKPVVAGLSAVTALMTVMSIAVLVYSRGVIATALTERTIALRNLEMEQGNTQKALAQKTEALDQKTDALSRLSIVERKVHDALDEKSAAFKRERITAYANTLTLARREWLEGKFARTLELLNTCYPDLRHWEWHYLRRICEPVCLYTASSVAGLSSGNKLPVTRDGKTLLVHYAAKSADDELVTMNTSTGVVTSIFHSEGEPLGKLALSGDGRILLSGSLKTVNRSHTSYIELSDVHSGQSIFKANLTDFTLHTLAINFDGTQWAISGLVWQPNEKSSNVFEVRLGTTGEPPRKIISGLRSLEFSPDGKRLITGRSSGFELWDTLAFTRIVADQMTTSISSSLGCRPCFRRDGAQFAYAAGEFITVFETATGKKICSFHVKKPSVTAVAFGRDDQKLAYGTGHGNVVLLDLQNGKEDELLRLPKAINNIEFSPDGSRLVTFDGLGELRVWDASVSPESDVIPGHARYNFTAAFDPSGLRVASVSDHQSVRVWDVATKELKRELSPFSGDIYDVAFSASGTQLATAGREGIQLWNIETGATIHRFIRADNKPMGFGDRVEFSRDGDWLVGGHERGATIWDSSTGMEVRSVGVSAKNKWFSSARLTADGSRLATCGQNKGLQLWDTDSGLELFKVEEKDSLYSLTFSPDEKQIIACGKDKDILIVDAVTGEEVRRLSGHAAGANTVAFSSDGKRLVSAGRDGMLKIWEPETGLELLSIKGPTTCYSATFSPDCRRLISTEIGALRIWDAGVSPGGPVMGREVTVNNSQAGDLQRFRTEAATLLGPKDVTEK